MSYSYQSFVEQKIKTAQAIAAGCCDGTYAEGSLILCSLISAMSAIAWPGDHIDKKRFVEIITRFPPFELEINAKKVSGPLLVQDRQLCNASLGISKKAFHLTEANDLDETEVQRRCPGLSLSEIRQYSYAHLLYREIRCSYVHQYRTGKKATPRDSIRQISKINKSGISYVNENRNNAMHRVIYFPLKWIAGVAEGVARGLDVELSKQGQAKMPFDDLCLKVPKAWWLDG